LAQQGLELVGYIRPEDLPRVQKVSLAMEPVQCHLRFYVDEQYRRLIEGELTTKVDLTCQRCLESVDLDVTARVGLAVVRDQEGSRALSSRLDPLIVSETETSLYEIVEEELLLNIPLIHTHDYPCIAAESLSVGSDSVPQGERGDARPNPFQVLEKLKKNTSGKS